jgi:outer membrane protein TolC
LNQNRAINFLKYIFTALLTAPLLSFALDKPRDMTTKHQEHNNSEGFKTAESNATLKHAIETIIHKSYRVKQAKERITQAKHSKDEAFGEFLPQVSVSTRWLSALRSSTMYRTFTQT